MIMELDKDTENMLAWAASMFSDVVATTKGEVEIARSYTERLLAEFSGRKPTGVHVTDKEVPTSYGSIPVRLYQHHGTVGSDNLPVVVFFHGGGWSVGDVESYSPFMEALCAQSGVAFLSVDFRLAPEHKYPAAHDDGVSVVKWLFDNADTLDFDPKRIAVMGDSAGANIAVATAWAINSKTQHSICSQYLLYPFLDVCSSHETYTSRMKFGDGQFLIGREALRQSIEWYIEPEATSDKLLTPLRLPNLGGLPPTVIVTAGFDPLTDEAIAFGEKLQKAGVPVTSRHFETTIHGFLPFGTLSVAREGQGWLSGEIKSRFGLQGSF